MKNDLATINLGFGQRMRFYRGNRSLTAVAREFGVSVTTVQRYEQGREPRAAELQRIAERSKRSESYWLKGEDGEHKVADPEGPYRRLGKRDRETVEVFNELIDSGDDDVMNHLRRQLALLKELLKRRRSEGGA